jgi:hypothetical protein
MHPVPGARIGRYHAPDRSRNLERAATMKYYVRLADKKYVGPLAEDEIFARVHDGDLEPSLVAVEADGRTVFDLDRSTAWRPLADVIPGLSEFGEAPACSDSLSFRVFRASNWTSWESMAKDVARFAAEVGRERVLSITQSEDAGGAVLIVWHWD